MCKIIQIIPIPQLRVADFYRWFGSCSAVVVAVEEVAVVVLEEAAAVAVAELDAVVAVLEFVVAVVVHIH